MIPPTQPPLLVPTVAVYFPGSAPWRVTRLALQQRLSCVWTSPRISSALAAGGLRAPSLAPTRLENISWPSIQLSYLGSPLGLFLSITITITYYNYLISLISWDRPHLFVKPSPCHEPLSFPSRDSGPATRCLGRPFCNASWCHLASSSRILPIDGAGNTVENP